MKESDRLVGGESEAAERGVEKREENSDDATINLEKREKVTLKRTLNLFEGIALIVGTMIGSGIFASPGNVLRHSGSVGMALAVWVFSGLLCIVGALSYAELGGAMPEAGGEYVYLRRAYGAPVAFMFTWTMFFVLKTSSQAIISTVFGSYIVNVVFMTVEGGNGGEGNEGETGKWTETDVEWVQRGISIFLILLLTVINCVGVKFGSAINVVFMILKLVACVVVTGLGFAALAVPSIANTSALSVPLFDAIPDVNLSDPSNLPFGGVSGFGVAMVSALWSYDGWNQLNFMAEEMKNPARDLKKACILGLLGTMLVYVLMNVAYSASLPGAELISSDAVASDVAAEVVLHFFLNNSEGGGVTSAGVIGGGRHMLGVGSTLGSSVVPSNEAQVAMKTARAFVAVCVAISTLGAANGSLMTGGRVYFAAARNREFPSIFAYLHPKTRTPIVSLALQAIWGSILVAVGNFETLVSYFGLASWLFYGTTVFALLVLRYKEPDMERPFRMIDMPIFIPISMIPASYRRRRGARIEMRAGGKFALVRFPILSFLFGCVAFALSVNSLVSLGWPALAALAFVLLAVPVYFVVVYRRRIFRCCFKSSQAKLGTYVDGSDEKERAEREGTEEGRGDHAMPGTPMTPPSDGGWKGADVEEEETAE